jgi:hypothetical protein
MTTSTTTAEDVELAISVTLRKVDRELRLALTRVGADYVFTSTHTDGPHVTETARVPFAGADAANGGQMFLDHRRRTMRALGWR